MFTEDPFWLQLTNVGSFYQRTLDHIIGGEFLISPVSTDVLPRRLLYVGCCCVCILLYTYSIHQDIIPSTPLERCIHLSSTNTAYLYHKEMDSNVIAALLVARLSDVGMGTLLRFSLQP